MRWPYPILWGCLLSLLCLIALKDSWQTQYIPSSVDSVEHTYEPPTPVEDPSAVDPHPSPHSNPTNTINVTDVASIAREQVQVLFDRQSTTLSQARSRYQLKTGRSPPPHYNTFYRFAKKHECLIDEYQQVYSDFAPWYTLAKDDPKLFRRRLEAVSKMAIANSIGIKPWTVENGTAKAMDSFDSSYSEDWETLFGLVCQRISFLSSSFLKLESRRSRSQICSFY